MMKRIIFILTTVLLMAFGAAAHPSPKELEAKSEKAAMAATVSQKPVEVQRDYYMALYKDELAKNKAYKMRFLLVGMLFFLVLGST